jgi:FkbM family methyltransferase
MSEIDRAMWLDDMKQKANRSFDGWRGEAGQIASSLLLHVPRKRLAAFQSTFESYINEPKQSPLSALLDPLISDNALHLWTGSFTFLTRKAIETIVEEILVRREYHFNSQHERPTVIDAGANIGLATYYAKRSSNAGKVICFEPSDDCHALLTENVRRNKFEDVEIHKAALGTSDGVASFYSEAEAPLGGSLDPRGGTANMIENKVTIRRLAPFLQQPIGFLKMDIEGAEADVLEDCAEHLHNVENIFCEVHPIVGQTPSLLIRVLATLEQAGFMLHVARSPWSHRSHRDKPITNANRTYSLSVYGTRIAKKS